MPRLCLQTATLRLVESPNGQSARRLLGRELNARGAGRHPESDPFGQPFTAQGLDTGVAQFISSMRFAAQQKRVKRGPVPLGTIQAGIAQAGRTRVGRRGGEAMFFWTW